MIRTEVLGCVGQDAVIREIAGNTYACFDLAVRERARGEERTTWVRVCKIDREQRLAQYITKGRPLFVEGRPQVSAYTNKEGQPAAGMTVWADRVEFVPGTGNGGAAATAPAAQQVPTGHAQGGMQQPIRQNVQPQAPQSVDLPWETTDDNLPY